MKSKLSIAASLLAALLCVTACSSSTEDPPEQGVESTSEALSQCTFACGGWRSAQFYTKCEVGWGCDTWPWDSKQSNIAHELIQRDCGYTCPDGRFYHQYDEGQWRAYKLGCC